MSTSAFCKVYDDMIETWRKVWAYDKTPAEAAGVKVDGDNE
jgi:hypothetical protein